MTRGGVADAFGVRDDSNGGLMSYIAHACDWIDVGEEDGSTQPGTQTTGFGESDSSAETATTEDR